MESMNLQSSKGSPTTDEAARAAGSALADLFKAMKTISFYPEGHPLRSESLRQAHKGIAAILNGKELTLVVTRAGFSAIEGGAVVDNNPMAQAFAKELFLRRTQRLTFLTDLSVGDLSIFLAILTMEPHKFTAAGSLEAEMRRRGIKTIWTNEIDLAQIWAKREAMEAEQIEEPMEEALPAEAGSEPLSHEEEEALSLEEVISRMEREHDDNQYLHLARLAAARGDVLKNGGQFLSLLPAMESLIRQANEQERSVTQREYAVFTLEQMAEGSTTDFLLKQLENRDWADPEHITMIVIHLGAKVVYPIIHRLCIADGLFARKALANALVRIGQPAIPPLINMLQDERWYVVRNMVAIIGEIGSRDCVPSMRGILDHSDQRVRKEVMRTLVKLGGERAEESIIALLGDKDASIVRQAVLSLGVMKSRTAIEPLLEIVLERDMFLTALALKKEAVQAIGRIGDKRATPFLVDILLSRRLMAWNRWEEMKIAVVSALGQLGDEAALPALKSRAGQQDSLGKACNEAIDTIERLAAEIYE